MRRHEIYKNKMYSRTSIVLTLIFFNAIGTFKSRSSRQEIYRNRVSSFTHWWCCLLSHETIYDRSPGIDYWRRGYSSH